MKQLLIQAIRAKRSGPDEYERFIHNNLHNASMVAVMDIMMEIDACIVQFVRNATTNALTLDKPHLRENTDPIGDLRRCVMCGSTHQKGTQCPIHTSQDDFHF